MANKKSDIDKIVKDAEDQRRQNEQNIATQKQHMERERQAVAKERAEIEKLNSEVVKLRAEKKYISEQWNWYNTQVSEQSKAIAEARSMMKQATDPSTKQYWKGQAESSQIERSSYSAVRAEKSYERSQKSADISSSLNSREQSEMALSASRQKSRELANSERERQSANRMSMGSFRRELSLVEDIDIEQEGRRAASGMRKMGGGKTQQKEYAEATKEFAALYTAVKQLKIAMTTLQEGTEEYADKQKELIGFIEDSAEANKKLKRMEDDAARKSGGLSFSQVASGVLRLGADMFRAHGERGAEKYVLEEERKVAKARVDSMYARAYMERGSSAESFLTTGGASAMGYESPFDKEGNVSQKITALAEDLSNVKRAVPTLAIISDLTADMIEIPSKIAASATEGSGETWGPLSGALSGSGTAIRETGKVAAKGMRSIATSPEAQMDIGLDGVSKAAENLATQLSTSIKDDIKKFGDENIKGSEKQKEFRDSVDKTIDPMTRVSTSLATLNRRAMDATNSMYGLMTEGQKLTQIQREQEKYAMALAPVIQTLINAQPTVRQALRTRYMDPKEKAKESADIESLSTGESLLNLGFNPEDIINARTQSGKALGWSGREGAAGKLTGTALKMEAAGFGTAGQTIQSATAIARTGTQDPAAALEKALQKAVAAGLRDSREFQELLEAAGETSKHTGTFTGSLDRLLLSTGTGLPGDVKSARDLTKSMDQEWGGATGTMTDMVKFNTVRKSVNDLVKNTQGVTEKTKNELLRMQYMTPDQMMDKDYLSTVFSEDTMKVLNKNKGFGEKLGTEILTEQHTYGTRWITQDKDYIKKVNAIKSGNRDELKKYFPDDKSVQEFLKETRGGETTYRGGDDEKGRQTAVTMLRLLQRQGIGEGVSVPGTPGTSGIKGNVLGTGGTAATKSEAILKQQAYDRAAKMNIAREELEKEDKERPGRKVWERYAEGGVGKSEKEVRTAIDKSVKGQETVTVAEEDKIKPLKSELNQIIEGLKGMKSALEDISITSMTVSVGKDVIVKSTKAVIEGGVDLGDAIGNAITRSVNKATGHSVFPLIPPPKDKDKPLLDGPVGGKKK